MLREGILLLHDNARPYTAAQTRASLDSFGWEGLDHPLYSPDLATSDFHLFRHIKHHLAGSHCNDDEDFSLVTLMPRFEATRYFGTDLVILNCDQMTTMTSRLAHSSKIRTTPMGGHWPLRMIQRATGPIQGGSSVESGFEPEHSGPEAQTLPLGHLGPKKLQNLHSEDPSEFTN
ncbi:hypothetical protein AVEN_72416-1 [Araneus ventricosus]|uniref:Histone-lysine N-methyltransferase SETMAR n=1 Tax=Araneus ventricosus TaxID=182803 RepID=A0A4Y2MMI9_ARAVE|nr:hypothetical protein AVEN_72416-1 [Araneus ventricosus]